MPLVLAPSWPSWPACPWVLPEGMEARRDGDRVALCLHGQAVTVVLGPGRFNEKDLPKVLARFGLAS